MIDLADLGLKASAPSAADAAALTVPAAADDPYAPGPLVPNTTSSRVLYEVWRGTPFVLTGSPPGAGKPVHVDEPVFMGDGTYKRLGDIQVGDFVMTHAGRPRRVSAVYEQGVIPTVKITTESGRIIRAAPDHPFLTPQGHVNAGDLVPGQALAALSEPRAFDNPRGERSDHEFRLAGYYVGDGSMSSGNCALFSADKGVADDFVAIGAEMGYETSQAVDPRGNKAICYRHVNPLGPKQSGGPKHWADEVGLLGATAHTKRVPDFVFRGSNNQVAQFLGAYFSTDGYVQNPNSKGRTKPKASFASVNPLLLQDVRSLLLRLGVDSFIRYRPRVLNGKRYPCWELHLRGWDNVARLHERATITHTMRKGRLNAFGALSQQFRRQFIPDPVVSVEPDTDGECRCLTVEDDHTFVVRDVVVHNTTLVVDVVHRVTHATEMNVVIVCPTRRACEDMARRLAEKTGPGIVYLYGNAFARKDLTKHGIITGQHEYITDVKRTTVKVQTVASAALTPPETDLLVFDEAYQSTFGDALSAAQAATSVLMVGDPGQIGPVITLDEVLFQGRKVSPIMRAPEGFQAHLSPKYQVVLSLPSTYRLGPATTEAIQGLYPFSFDSKRPNTWIEGYDEVAAIVVEDPESVSSPELIGAVANRVKELVWSTVKSGGEDRTLRPSDIAVVASRNEQTAAIEARLSSMKLDAVSVGTADRLQGGQMLAVVALDPITGADVASAHALDLGRLCVMVSRHVCHLTWVTSRSWRSTLSTSVDSKTELVKHIAVREALGCLD